MILLLLKIFTYFIINSICFLLYGSWFSIFYIFTYLCCDIILEIFIGIFIEELLLNISHASSLFNLFNYWVYSDIPNIWIYILYCFMLALGSFIILYLIYGKKEDVIIASEK